MFCSDYLQRYVFSLKGMTDADKNFSPPLYKGRQGLKAKPDGKFLQMDGGNVRPRHRPAYGHHR